MCVCEERTAWARLVYFCYANPCQVGWQVIGIDPLLLIEHRIRDGICWRPATATQPRRSIRDSIIISSVPRQRMHLSFDDWKMVMVQSRLESLICSQTRMAL